MNRALIFDCDGVLGDTEPYGHRVAFNRMWREAGVRWEWSVEDYGRSLGVGGGKERMARLLEEPAFRRVFTPPEGEADRRALLATWHQRKSALFREIVEAGQIPPRSGVRRLAGEAWAAGWKLAVASTSALDSVEAMVRVAMGHELRARFAAVLAGDVVARKKPAPDIYEVAAERLGVRPRDCVVIEDSALGLAAATAACMRCLITPSAYTGGEAFDRACLVVSCLGDPGGERSRVLLNRTRAAPGERVRLADLEALLDGGDPADPNAPGPD